jgi:hypothetical protein
MQERLASLGFAMALEPVPNLKGFDLNVLDEDGGLNIDYYGTAGASLRKMTSGHTVGRPAHTSGDRTTAPASPFLQRPTKRRRVDSPLPNNIKIEQPVGRNTMPPPQKPVSRMRSMRKILPTLRKKLTGGQSSAASDIDYSNSDDMQMFEDGHCDDAAYSSIGQSSRFRHDQAEVREDYRHETSYMSGALPIKRSSQARSNGGQHFPSSVSIDDGPGFTFGAASPLKMSDRSNSHQPVQLPTEPSYIRLMDGLSRDNGVELGLKDPRANQANTPRPRADKQGEPFAEDRRRFPEVGGQEDWGEARPSHYHSQNEASFPAGPHFNSMHQTQINTSANGDFRNLAMEPITPAHRRHQQPGHRIENVVSPNIDITNRSISPIFKPRIAEPQDSSTLFVAYRSPRPQMAEPDARWRDRNVLNGLSFFESPVLSRNQSTHSHREQQPLAPRHYQSRNLDSSGYFIRPDTDRSPFFRDSAYGSSGDKPTYSREQPTHKRSSIPFSSFNRPSHHRTGRIPSAMPSIVSSVRTQPQWEGLQRMGVRSSRRDFSGIEGNTYISPSRKLFSNAGRMSIRR